MKNSALSSLLLQGRIPRSHLLQIHAQTILSGEYQDNFIATKLIGHYPYHLAIPLLRQLQRPNIFPFNATIRVLSDQPLPAQAFSVFLDLKRHLISPNDFTFCFLLKSMSRHANSLSVHQLHVHCLKSGFCNDPFVRNALLNVYAKGVRNLESACKVFDEIPDWERSSMVSCWTGLIAGCAQTGENEQALQIFLKMITQQLNPDSDTMVSVLSACATLNVDSIERWINLFEQVHGNVGDDQVNVVLTYLYGKAGDTEKSRAAFDEIRDVGRRSVVTWNAIINVYVQNGCASEALSLFQSMMEFPHVQPNHVTMVSALSACAQIGDINLGGWIHEYIKSKGKTGALSMNNSLLATALIDMYSKCGDLKCATEVFNLMASKDVVSVNAMIMGLALNGKGDNAISLYEQMRSLDLKPNAATFLGVLYSCSHSGMVEKGREIFHAMRAPQLEHYACYIDLLARIGCIEEAIEVVRIMPIEPNNYVWGALLNGCLVHSRTELAMEICNNLIGKDPENSGGYVMLSNALAGGLKWSGVYKLRGVMREKRIKKHPGCSWITVDEVVHQFLAGVVDSYPNPNLDRILNLLDTLHKEIRICC